MRQARQAGLLGALARGAPADLFLQFDNKIKAEELSNMCRNMRHQLISSGDLVAGGQREHVLLVVYRKRVKRQALLYPCECCLLLH